MQTHLTYRGVNSCNYFIFQYSQKFLSRGPSLPCPPPTKQPRSQIGQAMLEIIGYKEQDLLAPYKPLPGPSALDNHTLNVPYLWERCDIEFWEVVRGVRDLGDIVLWQPRSGRNSTPTRPLQISCSKIRVETVSQTEVYSPSTVPGRQAILRRSSTSWCFIDTIGEAESLDCVLGFIAIGPTF